MTQTHGKIVSGAKPYRTQQPRRLRKPVRFMHVHDPAGRVFLIVVQKLAEQLVEGDKSHWITRKFAAIGLTKEAVFARMQFVIPAYAPYYQERTGEPLTPHIVFQRYHKAIYGYDQPVRGSLSNEHYTKSPRLLPLHELVHGAMQKGRALTLAEMNCLGEGYYDWENIAKPKEG